MRRQLLGWIVGTALLAVCHVPAQSIARSPELPTATQQVSQGLLPTSQVPQAVANVVGARASSAKAAPSLPEKVVAQLDQFLQSQVYSEGADPRSHAPGAVLLVDTPEGRYLKAAGVASLESGTPLKVDDRLEIGSNSKSFTIVLLLQLQEKGLLSLDDPLSKWLPDWSAKIPNGDRISLRQLAQHTSGIWDYADPLIGEAADNPDKLEQGYTPAQLVQYAIDHGKPDFAPGQEGKWKYSNTGYILLGMILEKATGQPLGTLYKQRIFEPLGLRTAALIEGVPAAGEITDGYWWAGGGKINQTTKWNVSQGWAAGAIAMTASELMIYAKALAAGELFQKPDTLATMLAFDPHGMSGLAPYGLGVMDFGKMGAPGSWGHEGQTAGFQSLWYTNPETGVTVVGLTNSATYSAFRFLNVAGMLAPEAGAATPAVSLTSNPWQWTALVHPVNRVELVDTPPSYQVTFNDDGTVTVLADCNRAAGTYTDEDGSMTVAIGPATLAACPEGSRGEEFVTLLGRTDGYTFADGQLLISLADHGGTMFFSPGASTAAVSGADLPLAEMTNDEGGPVVATGEWAYTAAAVATHYQEPVAMLMDLSDSIKRNYTEWVPRSGQIMGTLTRPLAPAPTAYQVNLPLQPTGASVDVDNDGEVDTGVQVFAAALGTNLVADSYLEQMEQGAFCSYLSDPRTGDIREGTLLVFAPDDAQGFPVSAGEDGIFFTADDPALRLPAGWTLVTLSTDGQVSFDRSRKATMNILEAAAYASPNFSGQGILESFNSLIDLLSVRYSYTELRGLNWEQIRQQYRPRVAAADAAGDSAAYYAAMNDLALSIKDAHVYVSSNVLENKLAAGAPLLQAFGGGLGTEVKELSNGAVAVTYLNADGPGAKAGWQVGTEIVSVDGVPMRERIAALPLKSSAGNPEVIRLEQTKLALAFPVGAETTIEYRQPGEAALRSIKLTAVEGAFTAAPKPAVDEANISFKELDNGIWYVQWQMFREPLYKIAIWERLLGQAHGASGLIIDMRHNGGGAVDLFYTMASYLFTADQPAQKHWVDDYTFDEKVGDLVKDFASDRTLSSPRPELTFTGAVAVLVGEGSASAAEYLPQFLQRHGRAIVVGEHGTEGAGGYLEQATMPGGFTFHFTKGRTFFAGTNELNLEAKGVRLDVRVPITVESELAKQAGRDVVLEAGMAAVAEEAGRLAAKRLPGTTWRLTNLLYTADNGDFFQPKQIDPQRYSVTFNQDGTMAIHADCNKVSAAYSLGGGGAITITPGAATLAQCPDDGLGEKFVAALRKVTTLQTDGQMLALLRDDADHPVSMLLTRAE